MDNPSFTFDPLITAVLASWEEQARDRASVLARLQATLAPTEAEQRMRHAFARHAAETSGIEAGLMRRVHDQQTRKLQAARRLLTEEHQVPPTVRPDTVPDVPPPTGPDFWWARTDWTHTDGFTSGLGPEGFVVTGGPNGTPQHNWLEAPDTVPAHFGAVALFQIPADRLVPSADGRWSSEPSLHAGGGLLASSCSGGLPGAGSSARGYLHLDHRLFQCVPGPDGAAAKVLGEAHTVEQLVDEDGSGQTVHRPMPGYSSVPPISFTGLDRSQPLWARLEVRVEVRVEGTGSFVWCFPGVSLTIPQWPLRPSS